MSYWSFEQRVSEDDALHYGVLGMKWGQHIFGKEYVRKKANKKLINLDKRAQRAANKADLRTARAFKKQGKADRAILFKTIKKWNASVANSRASRSISSVRKYTKKARKLAKAMNTYFKSINEDPFTKEVFEIGQHYLELKYNLRS